MTKQPHPHQFLMLSKRNIFSEKVYDFEDIHKRNFVCGHCEHEFFGKDVANATYHSVRCPKCSSQSIVWMVDDPLSWCDCPDCRKARVAVGRPAKQTDDWGIPYSYPAVPSGQDFL